MKKNRKLILGMVISVMAIAPIAASCGFGGTDTSGSYAKTDAANIRELVKTKDAEVQAAIEANTTKKLDIVLLTAGGKVNDLSFNQSVWEAISQHSVQTKNNTSSYIEPADDAAVTKSYDELISGQKNVWVLTGFQHSYLFKNWLLNANGRNLDALANSNAVVVGVDWILDKLTPEQQEKLKGKIITLNYKTEESGWIAGYAAADFLAKKYPDASDRAKRGIATFGGHPGKGVTDFITGFLGGIKHFNSEQGNNGKKALITSKPIVTDTNFSTQDTSKVTLVQNITTNGNPAIILPVAGPFTNTVEQSITSRNTDQSIIGVDTDQSMTFSEDKRKLFFTSIEKRIGATIYRVLTDLFIQKANSDIISNFNTTKKIEGVKLGYWDGFVSLSPTTKEGNDKEFATTSLQEAKNKFESIVPKAQKDNASALLGIKEMVDVAPEGKTVKEVNEGVLNALIAEINA
ncbi:ABC transporter xylose-binding lipoprotein [[Mycoplasma] phocae]|uniref:ABC transporter xylose-binding lipoprotein n=1 Tax=[Mycoplasma] phocae TaxID=142651 RepID=A0A2Z5IR63_9BACT|nr:BMP family ABC transporter substrate-binding protein [[Mycoplasma] phocae]AXE60901.1 ABC transporter xylose-binding lipoprotein [[Mycoplasma] phocae]